MHGSRRCTSGRVARSREREFAFLLPIVMGHLFMNHVCYSGLHMAVRLFHGMYCDVAVCVCVCVCGGGRGKGG